MKAGSTQPIQRTSADMDRLIAAAEAAADVAGAVVRPFFRAGLGADQKADRSPVTIADRTAEQAMRAVLTERFPEHGVLGEEFGLDRPDARLRWVLDPIDGTRAFITGRPTFGTLIALLDGDRPILGVIDQPVTRERWVGAAGRRTRFSGPLGGRAGCRACAALAEAELSCTSAEMMAGDAMAALAAPGRCGAAQLLGRRLLRLRAAGAGPDRRGRRARHEAVGLGGAGAGGRGRRRPRHRLVRRDAAPGRRRHGAGGRRRGAAGPGGGIA